MVCLTPAAAALLLVVVLAAAVSALPAINVTTMAFEDGYAPLFGHGNILRSADHRTVSLLLDRSTGGFTYMLYMLCLFVFIFAWTTPCPCIAFIDQYKLHIFKFENMHAMRASH